MKSRELLNLLESISDEQSDTYKRWSELVNMTKSELEKYIDSELGKESGLSREDAEGPIKRGRDSARAIVRMLDKPNSEWSDNDWEWAKRQVSFISRMSAGRGPLYDDKGRPTRKLMSLLIWGHKPKGFRGFKNIGENNEKSFD